MTIKSMPPASSHLAEIPVPAPPTTTGLPAAIFARKRSRMLFRSLAILIQCLSANDVAKMLDCGRGKRGVVDVMGQPDDPALLGLFHCFFKRLEEGRIGFRIVKG